MLAVATGGRVMLIHRVADLAFAAVQALYLFAPLVVAAALSGIFLRWDLAAGLKRPIDGGRYLGHRRVLGDSKTWRGVFVAMLGSVLATVIQKHVAVEWTAPFAVVDYRSVNALWFGCAMGAGATLGELPNSFVKRRLGLPPGGTKTGCWGALFWVWDQIDLLTGCWPLILPWVHPTAALVLGSVIVALAIHPLVALIGYVAGARRSAR